jgi:adenylate cyclase
LFGMVLGVENSSYASPVKLPITNLSQANVEPASQSLSQEQRRLAAIMFTDMVGYTALGQRNESLSLALVEEQRKLVRPILARHNGREVKTIGDAFLVEFGSALDAARCAYEIQRATKEFNLPLAEDKRVHLRIGVHLGDVVESQGDISGDAVNVASRIESLAEDGGVCITRQVYDQIKGKSDIQLSGLGPKSLKNVADTVEVYRMVLPWGKESTTSSAQLETTRVAVLPFANMSPDPSDEYFADGMTEELIDRLSQVRELRVIARTSVMGYKKHEKKVSEIGRELGVGSLVEGSVRKAGNMLRINVQLVDAVTEEHLWSDRYDKELDDIFAVQTDIATKVTTALAGALAAQKTPRISGRDTNSVSAYSYFLRGRQLTNEGTGGSVKTGLEYLEKATEIDPSFARAYASMSSAWLMLGLMNLTSYDEAVTKAKVAVNRALELNKELAEAHAALSWIAWVEDDFPRDEDEAKIAINLNPNLAMAYEMMGTTKATQGYPLQSIRLLETAHSLDPLSPRIIAMLGGMYIMRGMDSKAEDFLALNSRVAPFETLSLKAFRCMQKGDYAGAELKIKEMEEIHPDESSIIAVRGQLEAMRGNRKGADAAIKTLRERFGDGPTINQVVGFIQYHLGDMGAFFDAMFRDVRKHTMNPLTLRYDPLLEKARKDPRYREVLALNGLDPDLKE